MTKVETKLVPGVSWPYTESSGGYRTVRERILDVIREKGVSDAVEIAKEVKRNRVQVYNILVELRDSGKVQILNTGRAARYAIVT